MQLNVGIDECDRATEIAALSPLSKQPIYVSSMKSSIKAPPYKNPPAYHGQANPSSPVSVSSPQQHQQQQQQKCVKFADSPVLLRRKVCFEDEILNGQQQQQLQNSGSPRHRQSKDSAAPTPPPRAEGTRLSTTAAPRRLVDSTSNPPHDFLQDLQRVMRKKWQISQKCKLEPATTPHEVLGFRDFDNAAAAAAAAAKSIDNFHLDTINSTPFYRESSNVSNWVQEHYGSVAGVGAGGGAAIVTVDSLYANLGTGATERCPIPSLPIMKKRPPPPPPKRNTTTVLTHRT